MNILLNGAPIAGTGTGPSPGSYNSFHPFSPFSITTGFLAGQNTLQFLVHNDGGPTGLRVDMTGTACRCTPEEFPLFGTGLTDTVLPTPLVLLGDNVVDPHFTIVSGPAGFTGATKTIVADGFPIPPWVANGPNSRWIAPLQADSDAVAPVGDYVYQITFSLAGFDPSTAAITGQWASDNTGMNILLNGAPIAGTGTGPSPGSYNSFHPFSPFSITTGFLAGQNTLQFLVHNDGGPTGLRVDMTGTACRCTPEEFPLFGTGLTDTVLPTPLVLLGDNVVDPHFTIVSGPAGFTGATKTIVADGFPIPPWVANGPNSRWIAPLQADSDAVAPVGDYVYQITFSLAGFDPSTAAITGQWASDNTGMNILLNGAPIAGTGTGPSPGSYNSFHPFSPFSITTGFLAGQNTLQFLVHNDGGPTGLRVDMTGTACRCTPEEFPLFGTGLTDTVLPTPLVLLGDNVVDPHFTVSGPAGFTGATKTIVADGFPIPPWVANGPNSRWIAPLQADSDAVAPVGDYVYRITFSLAGFDPSTAAITGQWASDNTGMNILLNGAPIAGTGTGPSPGSYNSFHPFSITTGFRADQNTLQFLVHNDGGPTGLRVDMTGTACRCTPEEFPLFGTGLTDTVLPTPLVLLGDNVVDPHFTIVSGPAGFTGATKTIVADGFPIPPWVANGPNSRWIAPLQADSDAVAPVGDYVYQITFSLAGFDPSTAAITGQWASDNTGMNILLNGAPIAGTGTGPSPGSYNSFHPFSITTGFRADQNTLQFLVHNDGGPTGLRVDMTGTACPETPPSFTDPVSYGGTTAPASEFQATPDRGDDSEHPRERPPIIWAQRRP